MWRCLGDPKFSCSDNAGVRQTHRQTHDDSIYHASTASCGKKLKTPTQYKAI